MASLGTPRSVSNTPAEHTADHNELHRLHNLLDTQQSPWLLVIDEPVPTLANYTFSTDQGTAGVWTVENGYLRQSASGTGAGYTLAAHNTRIPPGVGQVIEMDVYWAVDNRFIASPMSSGTGYSTQTAWGGSTLATAITQKAFLTVQSLDGPALAAVTFHKFRMTHSGGTVSVFLNGVYRGSTYLTVPPAEARYDRFIFGQVLGGEMRFKNIKVWVNRGPS